MAARDVPRHAGQRRAVDLDVAEVDEAHADLGREGGDELALGQHTLVDEDPSQAAPELVLRVHGGSQLLGGDKPAIEQDVAELLHEVLQVRVVGPS